MLLCSRTKLWKHKNGCLKNSLKGFLKNFYIGFGLNGAKILLFGFLRQKNLLRKLNLTNLISWIRLGAFLGIWNSSYKIILCLCRRYFKDDKISSVIAGSISALALSVEESERRISIALIIFARSLHASSLKIESDRSAKYPKKIEILSFCVILSALVYISIFHVGNILGFNNYRNCKQIYPEYALYSSPTKK